MFPKMCEEVAGGEGQGKAEEGTGEEGCEHQGTYPEGGLGVRKVHPGERPGVRNVLKHGERTVRTLRFEVVQGG